MSLEKGKNICFLSLAFLVTFSFTQIIAKALYFFVESQIIRYYKRVYRVLGNVLLNSQSQDSVVCQKSNLKLPSYTEVSVSLALVLIMK